MAVKNEIKRRLKKTDYTKISKELYDKSFDSLSNDEYTNILKIADIYGAKYKKIYKLKNDVDIRTLTSNLTEKDYAPAYHTHFDLQIIGTSKTDTGFLIYTEFSTTEEVFVDVVIDNKQYKQKQNIDYRRIMVLEKSSDKSQLIVSIDPTGEGASVYKKLDENLTALGDILQLNFNDFFDIMDIEKAIYKLVKNNKLIPNRLVAKDETTKRVKSVYAQVKDNIKDDDIYGSCENSGLKLENIKMKFNKETIELYGKTLLKISTRANKKVTDELTENIISIL